MALDNPAKAKQQSRLELSDSNDTIDTQTLQDSKY